MNYRNNINKTVLLAAISVMAIQTGCESGGSTGSGSPVMLTLNNSDTTPASNSVNVNVKPTINIVVMEDLDIKTVTSDTVHLMPGVNHNMAASSSNDDPTEDSNMDVISGQVNFNEQTRTINIVPDTLLAQGQMYHIRLVGVKLKNGTPVENGMYSLHYSFTTAHAHEYRRVEYDDNGNVSRETLTEINNLSNQITKITRYDGPATNNVIERMEFYNTQLGDRQVFSYRTDANGIIHSYEASILENGTVVANASYLDNGDTDYNNDPIRSYWTPDTTEGDHEITFHYTAIDRQNGAFWSSTPANDFELMHVSLMEMNHAMAVNNNASSNSQNRHIFYSDIGDDGVDLDNNGNPAPVNDVVRVYHTFDLVNGKRTRSWSWYGTGAGEGQNGVLFDNDDLAYRVEAYEFDSLGRRSKRLTYSISRRNNEQGKTRAEWENIISTTQAKSYREYLYDPTTNLLTQINEYEYDNLGNAVLQEQRFYRTS